MNMSDSRQKWSCLTFIFGITWLTYANALNMSITLFIGNNIFDTLISIAIIGWCTLNYLLVNRNRIKPDVIAVFVIVLAILYLDKLHPNHISEASNEIIHLFLTQGYLGYVFARSVDNSDDIDKCLKYIAVIIYISCFYMPFFPAEIATLYGGASAEEYGMYMTFGYRMMPGVLIFFHLYYQNRKKTHLILFIAGFIEIILFANRGSTVGIIVFYFLYTLLFGEIKEKAKQMIIIGVLFAFYLYFTSPSGLEVLIRFLDNFNIKSRNLTKMMSDTLQVTGRDHIYLAVEEKIKENWILGVGFSGAWFFGKPHNIIYEMFLDFGVIGAAILIVLFTIKSIRILFDKTTGPIYLIFLVAGLIPSLFSGSYIISWMFWVLMGMMVSLSKSKNKMGAKIDDSTNSCVCIQQSR